MSSPAEELRTAQAWGWAKRAASKQLKGKHSQRQNADEDPTRTAIAIATSNAFCSQCGLSVPTSDPLQLVLQVARGLPALVRVFRQTALHQVIQRWGGLVLSRPNRAMAGTPDG